METGERLNLAPKIELAQPDQVENISKLAGSAKLDLNANASNGFLVYPLSPEQYLSRLNRYFYQAKSDTGLDGFLMAYDNDFLNTLLQNGNLSYEDGVLESIFSMSQSEPFVYGDQIVVSPDSRHKGVGMSLIERLRNDMYENEIGRLYVAILNQPIMNLASRGLIKEFKAEQVAVSTNSDDTNWDIFLIK